MEWHEWNRTEQNRTRRHRTDIDRVDRMGRVFNSDRTYRKEKNRQNR
jgi:hypothetical protein